MILPSDNKKITELVKTKMVILGPYIAIALAKELPSLKVLESGETKILSGTFEASYTALEAKFVSLVGDSVKSI